MAMFQRIDQEEVNGLNSMGPLTPDDPASFDTNEDDEIHGVAELMYLETGTMSARNCLAPLDLVSRRGRMASLLLVGVLAVVATVSLAPWKKAAPEEQMQQPRLLQSEDLLSTIVEHSMRFHDDFAGEAFDGESPTHQELLAEARKHVHETVRKVTSHSAEAGRILQDMRLTKTQWSQSKEVLNALHDKRVQEMGQYVQKAVAESETPEEAMQRVATKERELRQLREELLPAGVQGVAETSEGQNHWGFSMQAGGVQASGSIGGWQGSMTIGGGEATTRRLMDKAQLLYMIIASAVVVLFGIISTIMTAVLGPAAATIFFIVTATLDAALCGTSLGLHHLPNFQNIYTWVPCIVLTSFTGLETIWTWNKGGGAAVPAAPSAATAAPPPTTAAPPPR